MAERVERMIEVSVGFMTQVPAVGRFEFVVHYTTAVVPTQQEVLAAITPTILYELGGQQEDWIIENHANENQENEFTYLYSFGWLHLNNKERSSPIMRTITFRPHRHRFIVHM